MESASRRLQQRENDVNNPFACTQNVRKTFVLPTAENNVNGKQRIKRKSAVQKRRSSTPPFLLMLFYKPFCRANICKIDVFNVFINQRFEKTFCRLQQINVLEIGVFAVFRVCGNAIFKTNIFLPVVLSFETCSLACLQCNFCVKVVFLR